MFWWIFGGTLALFSLPVLVTIITAIAKPFPRSKTPTLTAPQQVNVTVQVEQSRSRRKIKPYSNLEQIAAENKSRRDSIHRRYYRNHAH